MFMIIENDEQRTDQRTLRKIKRMQGCFPGKFCNHQFRFLITAGIHFLPGSNHIRRDRYARTVFGEYSPQRIMPMNDLLKRFAEEAAVERAGKLNRDRFIVCAVCTVATQLN